MCGFLGMAVMLEQTTCLVALVKCFFPSSPCPGIWESGACRAYNTLVLSIFMAHTCLLKHRSLPGKMGASPKPSGPSSSDPVSCLGLTSYFQLCFPGWW